MTEPVPEPLRTFDGAAAALSEPLRRFDELAAQYWAQRAAGNVLPNVMESLRIELTYHSNALEGNTLTLRETQLVIEGRSPARERPMRELYEARNRRVTSRRVPRRAGRRERRSIGACRDFHRRQR